MTNSETSCANVMLQLPMQVHYGYHTKELTPIMRREKSGNKCPADDSGITNQGQRMTFFKAWPSECVALIYAVIA